MLSYKRLVSADLAGIHGREMSLRMDWSIHLINVNNQSKRRIDLNLANCLHYISYVILRQSMPTTTSA